MPTKILIVDDEPAIGKLLIYQLSTFGYQVSYIQDSLLALQRLSSERPDLVLLDVMMPRMSGWEICRQIRACSAVPVIMLTAKSAEPDILSGLQAGADDYIIKPFSMAQLQARIETVLRRVAPPGQRQPAQRTAARPDPQAIIQVEPRQERLLATTTLPQDVEQPAVPSQPFRLGQYIRATRQARGLSLHQIERACKIRWEFLQAIEQENWDYMPREELRRALRTYTSYLGLDLASLVQRPKPKRRQPLFQLQFAAALALVMVLLVVGMYLL